MDRGPYRDQEEAKRRLTAHARAVYHRPVGVPWSCGTAPAWLQSPTYDA